MTTARVLLIVDDQPLVARTLRRCLVRKFDAAYVANEAMDAESILRTAVPPVTHVICDFYLGADSPLGTVLLARWRKEFTSIEVALIVSGSELGAITRSAGVDAVLGKPVDVPLLLALLGVTATA
jgi:ActR/RegA family two-component response regulator